MEITTFEDDLLNLKNFADRLERFIAVENDYVQGSLVIALSSKFGSGKSSFLRMWSNSLAAIEDESEKPLVVSLNAWESDYYGDPLYAIISALIDRIINEGQSAERLISAVKDFGWFATVIGAQIVNKVTGIDAVAAGGLAEDKRTKREGMSPIIPDSFSIYEDRQNAMLSLKDVIQEYVEDNNSNVLFMVDELDRCRPDYAISYLEIIKHIFDVKGAVFILACDRRHLENSAKTAFGPNLDFEEYYRKFIHREITLPDISEADYSRLASVYVKFYLEREGSRVCYMDLDSYRIKNIIELITSLKLTPRQIQEIFRILGHVFTTTIENRGQLLWGLAIGTIFMASLKVGKPEMFKSFGHRELEPKEAFEFLYSLFGDSHMDWWLTFLFSGGSLRVNKGETIEDVMKEVGLLKDDEETGKSRGIGQFHHGWGWGYSPSNKFIMIREKIDQISQWN